MAAVSGFSGNWPSFPSSAFFHLPPLQTEYGSCVISGLRLEIDIAFKVIGQKRRPISKVIKRPENGSSLISASQKLPAVSVAADKGFEHIE